MSNKSERLYDAITNISDTYIDEAQDTRFSKKSSNLKSIRRFTAVAATFAVILFGVFAAYNSDLFDNMTGSPDEVYDSELNDSDYTKESVTEDSICDDVLAGEGIQEEPEMSENKAFMSYSGSVMPMSFVEKNSEITAVRNVTFDFVRGASGDVNITDSYMLTNSSNTDETVIVLYPFVNSVGEINDNMPTVTLNGRYLDTEIHTVIPEERSYESYVLADVLEPIAEYILYIESEIIIPAGETVTISAEMVSSVSDECDHYDIITSFGSSIKFTEQTVSIIENGNIEIVDQNFGFDLENGVKTVVIDISKEHYYLEIN